MPIGLVEFLEVEVVRQEVVVEEVTRVEEEYQAEARRGEAGCRVLEVVEEESCAWSGVVVVRPKYQGWYL
jgi:putative IMPACT (imprinted ancient) family translation regulator